MIQCQNPVSVGWGNYVIAWLLTYSGSDCRLWQYVLQKCMESGLCREVVSLLPTIGYDLRRHKCYDLLDVEMAEANRTPQPPNQPRYPNHPTAQNHPSSLNRLSPRNKHLLKRSKTKLLKTKMPKPLRALEIKAPPLGPPSLPQPSPPRWAAPDRGAHWV